jgi:hypothetical protein
MHCVLLNIVTVCNVLDYLLTNRDIDMHSVPPTPHRHTLQVSFDFVCNESIYRVAFGADVGKVFCFIAQDKSDLSLRCYAFGCKSKKLAGEIADVTAMACTWLQQLSTEHLNSRLTAPRTCSPPKASSVLSVVCRKTFVFVFTSTPVAN